MGLKDLHLKFKAIRLRRFLAGVRGKKRRTGVRSKPSWMVPVSHGYHVVEDQSWRGAGSDDSGSDSVVVQREQIEELEVWFFGVFDPRIGDGVTKYLQSHLFNKNAKESHIRRKSKETMRKAYLGARAKARESQTSDETWRVSSASVMVINGEKLVIANMGDYRAVVCRDGVAREIHSKHQKTANRQWSRRLFPEVRMLAWKFTDPGGITQSESSELVVGVERIDSDTEFVIIASTGVWEVMKSQEAVNLIRHLEQPQEAAKCLAKEASSRMSKSNISCVVIRFD